MSFGRVAQVGYLHGNISTEDGAVREDSADSHVDSLINVDRPLSLVSSENLLYEEMRGVEIASAVCGKSAVFRKLG